MANRTFGAFVLAISLVACTESGPATGGGDEPRTVRVRMSDELRFEPDTISVRAGETVRFKLVNEGQTVHEFLIGDEAAQAQFAEEMASGEMHHATDAGVSVDPGQTQTFEYPFADTGGELLAGCHEPGHYDGGMVAKIVVDG